MLPLLAKLLPLAVEKEWVFVIVVNNYKLPGVNLAMFACTLTLTEARNAFGQRSIVASNTEWSGRRSSLTG